MNTTYFIPTTEKWLAGLLNSPCVEWFYSQIANRVRGGYMRAFSDYMKQVPIPTLSPNQQQSCERLTEALIWLHSPRVSKKTTEAPVGMMQAYFEQWLNGLVYELFFPAELHARKLTLFDETAKLNLPDLAEIPEAQKLPRLRESFESAYDTNSPLRAMLFDLHSIEEVRVIEERTE
ncbi:MAG: hypothetical protein HYY13_03700 [Nitrospirae bacterium]|nr:hypothetical protein [Nitrospirota bacterium]